MAAGQLERILANLLVPDNTVIQQVNFNMLLIVRYI
jgi:hypothetical protein